MPCLWPLDLQLPSASWDVVELGFGHTNLGCIDFGCIDFSCNDFGCIDFGCIDFGIDDSFVGKIWWVGRSRSIPTPRIGWSRSHEEVHICLLENESNLLRFNLPIYPVHRHPKGVGVIVSGGLVRYRGGGGDSEELVVGYTLSDSGASHKFVSRELIGRLESKSVQLTWRKRGSMRVMTARETSLVPFHQVQLTVALGGGIRIQVDSSHLTWYDMTSSWERTSRRRLSTTSTTTKMPCT
jgi:hypothetical protein